MHNQQWPSAQRVAENYDPDSVPDILVGQARQAFQEQNYSKFESLLLRAGRSEMAIGLYKASTYAVPPPPADTGGNHRPAQ